MGPPTTTSVRIALDWTPNTIHTGLYLALETGLYSSRGLDVQLLPPDADYSKTPAKRVEDGEVELAVCPSESCIAYHQSGKMRLQAVYAILQQDASAIASTKLASIGELGGGRIYGSYNARYEDRIVQAMVRNAGGDGRGVKIERQAGKLSLFDSLKEGQVDATWIFMPWEGVDAELSGVELKVFRLGDYGIPYGYSPVIAHDASAGRLAPEVLKNFVAATVEGYRLAIDDVSRAVGVLRKHCTPPRSDEFLRKSQEEINGCYSDGSALGKMSEKRWRTWLDWLEGEGMLEASSVSAGALFTNP